MNDMSRLISKKEMLGKDWNDFDKYPKNGDNIMLHIIAHHIGENKNSHDFIPVVGFNAASFCMRDYIPKMAGVSWICTWLPMEELIKNNIR